MLNEEKLKLMTGIALFEKAEGGHLAVVRRYYRGDYIGRSLFKGFLGYSLCWCVGLALAVYCKSEEILSIVSLTEIRDDVIRFAGWYLAGLAGYLTVLLIVRMKRYRYASRAMKVYMAKLRRLEKRYEFQNRASQNRASQNKASKNLTSQNRTKELGREVRRS